MTRRSEKGMVEVRHEVKQKLRKIPAISTFGTGRLSNVVLGDPPRRMVKRLLRALPGQRDDS
jgi:hypothetical protein